MDEMETEQKFKVGDMVVPVKLDMSSTSYMKMYIGLPGAITEVNPTGRLYRVHDFWWKHDSVKLSDYMENYTELIAKVKDLLNLIAGTQAGESETVKDINDLIYKIQNEKK